MTIEVGTSFDRGPGKIAPGFYNRTMEVSRDVTVALLQAIDPGIALDALAGTGIRGLRIAKETGWEVVLNDRDPRNLEIQRRNGQMNSLELEMLNLDYFCAVSSRKWDYIDVDPYGSPSGMIDVAILNLKDNGILGVTMTDTANLEGRSIEKGLRIYGSRSVRGEFAREVATRIFVKYVIERGAALSRGGQPLVSLRDGHYIRTFIRFKKGNRVAEKALKDMRFVRIEGKRIGPLFTGRLYDQDLLRKMETFSFSERSRKLFSNFSNEDLMPLFFRNEYRGREVKKRRIIEAITGKGYRAGPTNFNDKGIKSDIPKGEYLDLMKGI